MLTLVGNVIEMISIVILLSAFSLEKVFCSFLNEGIPENEIPLFSVLSPFVNQNVRGSSCIFTRSFNPVAGGDIRWSLAVHHVDCRDLVAPFCEHTKAVFG